MLDTDDDEISIVQLAAVANQADQQQAARDDDQMLSQSQYGQVVFENVADASHEEDMRVVFSFSSALLSVNPELDLIGLYKVPAVAPEQAIATKTIASADKLEVVFDKSELPKDADFYLLQYLRGHTQVLGSSIPFRLKSSARLYKPEEFVTTEDDEFQVIHSNKDRVIEQIKGKLKETEKKYSALLELSERLTEDVNQKQERILALEEQLARELRSIAQLKEDLTLAVDEKVRLKEQLESQKNNLGRTDSENSALKERVDELEGVNTELKRDNERGVKECEKKEELLTRLKGSFDVIKPRFDQLEKDCLNLNKDNAQLEAALDAEKTKMASLQNDLAMKQEQLDEHMTVKEDQVRLIDSLNGTLLALRGEHAKQLEGLKLELASKEEDFTTLLKTNADLTAHKGENERISQDLHEQVQRHKDLSDSYADVRRECKDLEKRLHEAELKLTFNETAKTYAENALLNMEKKKVSLEERCRQLQTELDNSETARANTLQNLCKLQERYAGEPDSSYVDVAGDSNSIGEDDGEDSSTVASLERQRQEILNDISLTSESSSIRNMSSLVIERALNTQSNEDARDSGPPREEDRDIAELQDWAQNGDTGLAVSASIMTPEQSSSTDDAEGAAALSFTMSDDGVPIPNEPLKCPMCPTEFKATEHRELEFHVENHLSPNVPCPLCTERFENSEEGRKALERHAQTHFPDENDSTVFVDPVASAPTVAAPGSFGNWDLGID